MAVKIRLARHGRHKLPYYRIIVADIENKRSGRKIEQIGTLDTLKKPSTLELDEERVKYWIGVGATPTPSVASLISKKIPGYLEELEKKRLAKIRASRAKRKARAGKTAKPAAKKASKAKAAAK